MWKIFFTYRGKSKCTVQENGIITPELAVLQAETLLDRMQEKESK